ncbi:hypothetical protein J6590_019009 [Homalodisca vitripennis]|nr:hypothetical protein J6590_019009 [Homalodisca vitripennis]
MFCLLVEVRANNPSLTLNLGTNGLKVTSEPTNDQAGELLARTGSLSRLRSPSSSHARRCLIRLSRDNRSTQCTAPLAIFDKEPMRLRPVPTVGLVEILNVRVDRTETLLKSALVIRIVIVLHLNSPNCTRPAVS